MFGVIQSMTYFIRTTFRDSEGLYGGHQDVPFQERCKGNGASPAIWLLISVYFVLIMKEEGHLSGFKSPTTGVVLTLIGFLFVDDTDLVVLGNKCGDEMSVHTRFQNSIYCWNAILRVSGKPRKMLLVL